jgi:hypothetical protein
MPRNFRGIFICISHEFHELTRMFFQLIISEIRLNINTNHL